MEEYLHPFSLLRNSIIVYSNGRNKIEEFGIKLKSHMDSENHMHDLDLIHVVGTMNKEDKTNYISKFLYEKENPHCNIKVLCATSVWEEPQLFSL